MRSNDFFNYSLRMAFAAVLLVLAASSAALAQTTVTATWDRNTDSYTAGYRVYYGTSPGNYQWSVDAGNQVSAPISVSTGYTYYFVVRAYNSSYEYGPPSNEATINLAPAPAPAPTASFSATLQSTNTALLTWSTANATTVTINGQSVATSGSTTVPITQTTTYTLVATGSGGSVTRTATVSVTAPAPAPAPTASLTATLQSANTALVTWSTTNATSASINGQSVALSGSTSVTVGQTTTFTLTATGPGGTVTKSATVTISNTAPGNPSGMAATVSRNRVTLSWRPPTTGGAPADYRLNVATYSGGTNVTNALNVGNVLSVAGDLPRGRYYARVRAANGTGLSGYSNEVAFRVGRWLRTPSGFRVTWQGTTATLSWTAPAADATEDVPTNYVLEAGTAPGLSNVAAVSVGNTTSFSTDITSGTYYVRVKAVNDLGESDPTEDLELRAPGSPNAPTYFMASGQGSQVDLRWTAPSGGSAPTDYVIEAGSAPGLADLAVLRVGNVTRFSTQAPPGTYYVRVRGVNAAGVGAASNEVVVRR
ncbi:MAG: fibronectin type III domain-containing protein [Acidobacteria bacterium]|nr:fibronectin type III domain-containing protein [Acidobacteriota bacterium]